jgi:hypothetical protein
MIFYLQNNPESRFYGRMQESKGVILNTRKISTGELTSFSLYKPELHYSLLIKISLAINETLMFTLFLAIVSFYRSTLTTLKFNTILTGARRPKADKSVTRACS